MSLEVQGDDSFTIQVGDDNIIFLTFLRIDRDKKQNLAQAQKVEKIVLDFWDKNPNETYDTIVSARGVTNITSLSIDAQRIYMSLMGHPQSRRLAFVALGTWLRGMIGTFAQLTGKWGKIGFFDTEAEAAEWVLEQRNKSLS